MLFNSKFSLFLSLAIGTFASPVTTYTFEGNQSGSYTPILQTATREIGRKWEEINGLLALVPRTDDDSVVDPDSTLPLISAISSLGSHMTDIANTGFAANGAFTSTADAQFFLDDLSDNGVAGIITLSDLADRAPGVKNIDSRNPEYGYLVKFTAAVGSVAKGYKDLNEAAPTNLFTTPQAPESMWTSATAPKNHQNWAEMVYSIYQTLS